MRSWIGLRVSLALVTMMVAECTSLSVSISLHLATAGSPDGYDQRGQNDDDGAQILIEINDWLPGEHQLLNR